MLGKFVMMLRNYLGYFCFLALRGIRGLGFCVMYGIDITKIFVEQSAQSTVNFWIFFDRLNTKNKARSAIQVSLSILIVTGQLIGK